MRGLAQFDAFLVSSTVEIADYALFSTRLVTIQFECTEALNDELVNLFETRKEFAGGFNMHPAALNLLRLADTVPAIEKLRAMFVAGMKHWLMVERVAEPVGADLVLFSNYANQGELTLVHNHNADLVGIYYARTAHHDQPPICFPR